MENTETVQEGGKSNKNIIFMIIGLVIVAGIAFFAYNTFAGSSSQEMTSQEQSQVPTATGSEQTPTNSDVSSSTTDNAETKIFQVNSVGFTFDPAEIKVKKGDTVKIVFTNKGGMHDWVLDEFNAKTAQIPSGQTAEVTFVADKAGTFEYYCSVGNHRQMGMVGNLIVEE